MPKPSQEAESGFITMSPRWFGTSMVAFELIVVCIGAYFVPDFLALSCERQEYKAWPALVVLGIFGVSAVGIFAHVKFALMRVPNQRRWLEFVLVGYCVTIFLYSSIYFILISFGDLSRANDQDFLCYLHDANKLGDSPVNVIKPKEIEATTFHGINLHVIAGILDEPPIKESPYPLKFKTAAEALEAIKSMRFDPAWVMSDHKATVYFDCLHFSIVTAATVGYGDIYPVSRIAKMVVDLQILSSTAILIIGFGFALNAKAVSPEDGTDGNEEDT